MACVALADGAGSRPRSEIGAEAVVRTTVRVLSSQFDEIFSMCGDVGDVAQRHIHRELLKSLSRAARKEKCDVSALASTLLFAAHKGSRFLAGHIGDGVIARIDDAGTPHTLSSPDNGEFANSTVFVTDAIAVDRFRLIHSAAEVSVSGFVLMSDGSAESLYDRRMGVQAAAISKLHAWNLELPRKKMEGILQANLEQVIAKKSSDDCSLALLSIRSQHP